MGLLFLSQCMIDSDILSLITKSSMFPEYSPMPGVYPTNIVVHIGTRIKGATILWTTNTGNDPALTESLESVDISLKRSGKHIVKARVHSGGLSEGILIAKEYTVLSQTNKSVIVITNLISSSTSNIVTNGRYEIRSADAVICRFSTITNLMIDGLLSYSATNSKIATNAVTSTNILHGLIDKTFGVFGYTIIPLPNAEEFTSVEILPQGRIFVAGIGNNDVMVARFLTNGMPDSNFSLDGLVQTDYNTEDMVGVRLAVGSDKKPIVAASFTPSGGYDTFFSMRYKLAGDVDTSFGNNGFVTNRISDSFDTFKCIAIQQDEKALLVGESSFGAGEYEIIVMRKLTNGSIDTSYGSNGIARVRPDSTGLNTITAMKIQPDGKLLICGMESGAGKNRPYVVRFLTNGKIDTNFANNGIYQYIGFPNDASPTAIAVQSDNRIVFCGQYKTDYNRLFLIRLRENGAPDNSFGLNGLVTNRIGLSDDCPTSVLILPDGKILIGGYYVTGVDNDIFFARFHSDGSLSPVFGKNGILCIRISSGFETLNSIAYQPDDRIVAVGSTEKNPTKDAFILQIWN